mgnify:FL=1|tara:strand:- start:88 stop:564 length:477 start_codon:yes stop_codon:yes gene_type:complete
MADLVVTITESVTLNGAARGSSNSLTISGVDDVYHRIITCPANNETRLVDFHSSVADAVVSAMDVQHVKYIRVTNLDTTNAVTLNMQVDRGEDDTAADESASVLLEGKKSFMLGSPHDGIAVSDANANMITDLVDLESLVVQPAGNTVQIEIFIASVV